MKEVVIVSGVRTPIGSFGGSLKDVPVVKLGALVLKEVLKKAGLRPVVSKEVHDYAPDKLKDQGLIGLEKKAQDWDNAAIPVNIDEVVMGNVLQACQGQNTARQATIYAGLPKEVNAMTVNKICASGLKAITVGATSIMAGLADVVIAGGMESMSCAPYALRKARWGYRMDVSSRGEIIDVMVFDGIYEIFYDYHMGVTAENIAELYGISRKEQDEFSVLSHVRARDAIKKGIFAQEIVPVVSPQKKGDPIVFDTDERPMDTNMDKMAKLAPVFKKDGTVTAGNASGINDAAAAVILMSKEKAKELGLTPIVKIKTFAAGALDPAYMGLGPVPACKKALKQAGLTMKDIDAVELNEAFASQSIACMRELDLTMEKTNLLGSGISLGHPIGCTGTRLVVTLMNEMKRKNLNLGLVTMCIGGGQGMAAIIERV
jgi:acetyl-CoA C-acetyltransferase